MTCRINSNHRIVYFLTLGLIFAIGCNSNLAEHEPTNSSQITLTGSQDNQATSCACCSKGDPKEAKQSPSQKADKQCAACQKAVSASNNGTACKGCAAGQKEKTDDASEKTKQEKEVVEEPDPKSSLVDEKQVNTFEQDRELFHFLLSHRDEITRKVTELENGVQTLTESSNPTITEKIQKHVASMYQRLENVQPIRMRDPLYREIFRNTDKIVMKLENTKDGIRVTETSDDQYMVKVIQSHAKVVSGFIANGFEEAHKNHEPPKRTTESTK